MVDFCTRTNCTSVPSPGDSNNRDVVNEFRALSIETLGVFVTDYPQEFQTDKYFKYFGWLFE